MTTENLTLVNDPPVIPLVPAGRIPTGTNIVLVGETGGGSTPPQVIIYVQKAYDNTENRWYTWESNDNPDTGFNNYPGTDSTPSSYTILNVK